MTDRREVTERLASLSPAKRALLERRRRGDATAGPAPALPRRAGTAAAPLSFSQQRLWFLDRLEPGAPTYNLRVLLRLEGRLDPGALAGAFQEVVQRHEVLRTAFGPGPDGPLQTILPGLELALPRVDLAALPVPAREAGSLALARALAGAGFDLARPPLLRAALFVLGPGDHRLLVVLHHIVSDGWSTGVLVREVAALYEARLAGRPSPLPELPLQFADYAVWQRGWLSGEVLEQHLGYWRERLAGIPAGLDLPTDRPRPAVQSFRGASCRLALGAGLTGALTALARQEAATPFMALAAGLFALLARLSGQNDLAIGSPVAGRNRAETEGLIGFFVNTLVLRADAGRERDFLGLLRQVREVTAGAFVHQDLPFEELVAQLHPDRDLSRTPLFQVALALHHAPLLDAALPGLAIRPEELPVDSAKFDLAFIVGNEGGGLAGSLEFATDLYDPPTAARLARQWTRLLEAAAAEPEADLAGLDLLSGAERHQLVREWNDTRFESGEGEALLHQLFERQADRQPGALAALWEDERLSYGELEARANRLARLLVELGAGPEAPVAVWMERSLDLLAALLATGKAGAAYLPLDAGWPAERAEAVLAGTGAGIVVTDRAHLALVRELQWRLPRLGDAVCLDVAGAELPVEPLDRAAVEELFDVVSERSVDWVTAAGFLSSYTGEPFAEAEVLEYRDRVVELAARALQGRLSRETRILEIGSGSGLILWELAPRVGRYVGLDPSPRTQQRAREQAEREGLGNVELLTGFAHEIESLAPGSFDLVILASTVQFFPGPTYLEHVLGLALRLVAPGGAVLVADVMDPRRREELRRSLAEYAAAFPGRAGRVSSPSDGGGKLHVDAAFFQDLPAVFAEAGEVEVFAREEGFRNELRFRYDAVIRKAVGEELLGEPAARIHSRQIRQKRVWTGWHVGEASAERPPLPASVSPDGIAYVIHTSGSTGEPKGIVVQHRPAVELVRWINRTFHVGPADRLLFVTSPAFDLSVYDVFGVLAVGGVVQVAPEQALREPQQLARLLTDGPITIWDSAPAALQQLAPLWPPSPSLPGKEAESTPALRLVLLSGDWIPVPLPDLVRTAFPKAQVISLGGATEATVWSNIYPIAAVDPSWPSIPYGRPMPNACYRVLDRQLAPCPIGVPGDLYIGGACLCVGYARLPVLTAERFLPDPFAPEPGARLYATGDRARHLRDGNLEFLGRVDQQVKIRGYRIELEEIESVLARQPGVREAAVVAREDVPGDKRLVGYVVPANRPTPPDLVGELRTALRQTLPEYMVPAALVLLERMPVTPNGKLDRKGLPAPLPAADATGFAAPATEAERSLAAIWSEVLGRDRIGRGGDFFELGGSSLVATQVISRVRQACGVELPLRALFEDRTLAGLAARIAELQGAGTAAGEPPLAAQPALRSAGEPLPLSFAQQRLWFLDQLVPGSALYNVPGAVRLTGRLSPPLLQRVLSEIARRHEVLRTTVPTVDGQPVPAVAAATPVALPVVDLAGLSAPLRRAETARRIAAEARRPFDLAAGPLLRATLLRLEPGEHVALVTFHHIAADGWSLGILYREIAALFSAWSAGEPSPLPELPLQYADFAAWQRRWLSGERLEAELGYWRRQLAGLPPLLELPTDRPRAAEPSFRGRHLPIALPAELVAPLAALAQGRGATLFMTLLAALAAVLGRAAGHDDLAVGTPVAGRDRQEIEGLIGLFVNTLALRVDLSGGPAFGPLLDRVRDAALGAFAHQSLPFERLVDELAPVRDPGHAPLVQTMLALQGPLVPLRLPGLALDPLPAASGTAKLDLLLSLSEAGGGLAGVWEYSTDLFDPATVARLSGHFAVLLAAAAAGDGLPLAELPLLAPGERHQLLREWNDTTRAAGEAPLGRCLHELVEEQAARRPAALAVAAGAVRLTYRELDRRARRLARRLVARGVGPEVCVGLCLDRSPELLPALLAVWKAGGAYLPLDPDHPRERLATLAAGLPLVLTLERWRDRLPPGVPALALDALEAGAEGGPEEDDGLPLPGRRAVPANLAYVLATSGSTGTPKGILVDHRGLVHYLSWAAAAYGMAEGSGAPVCSPLGFDLTVTSLLGPLLAGRTVDLRTESDGLEALRGALAADADYSLVKLTPAHLEALRQDPDGWQLRARVRVLILGGEALHGESLDLWRARSPATRIVNEYGPTETVVGCVVEELPAGVASPRGPVPIGRPIRGMRAHVLDAALRPLPAGVPGELYLAGAGLARGYRGLPALTAATFLPDPWSGAGERLYRTGDLVRRLADGRLVYLGRTDHQVKVRGFRIELGEIEAALAAHPAVGSAAVVAAELHGQKRLVAFWVAAEPAASGAPISPAELRAALRERLPEPMVPADLLAVEALPQTANGKVDRRELLRRAAAARSERAAGPAAPPRSAAEERLAGIWAAVLGRSDFGVHDNFFELGGDSILSIQVVARARQAGLGLTPRDLFRHQTIAEVAAVAREVAGEPAAEGEAGGEVPLAPIQRWFFGLGLDDPHHYNQALLLDLREPADPARLAAALGRAVRHHAALGFRFERDAAGAWHQLAGGSDPASLLAHLDFSALPADRRRPALEAAALRLHGSLDLARGPLLRAALFDLGGGGQRLFLVCHHLVVDGVSWRILLGDLEAAYRAAAVPLPPVATSFRRWAARLAEEARSAATAAELPYWLAPGRAGVRPLPVDRPGGPGTMAAARTLVAELDAEETRALLQDVPAAYHSRINDALLAALLEAFAGWTGEPRLLVDLEGHGRGELAADLDTSRSVGWFTALYPVLLEVPAAARSWPGAGDPGERLKAVKEQLRAVPREGLGYGLLRHFGADVEAVAGMPAAEVLFNYLGQLDRGLPESSLFAPAPEPASDPLKAARSPRQRRSHLLEINGGVAGGRLQLTWTYGEAHDRRTVQALADRFVAALRALIAHCRSAGAGGFTPSDFPEARFSDKDLATLMARIGKRKTATGTGRPERP